MKLPILLLSFCLAMPAFAQVDAGEFDAKVNAINAARQAGKLTELQYAKEAKKLVDKYMSTDYDVQTLAAFCVLQATKLQEKKISRAEYDYLIEEKWNAYRAKRQQEHEKAREDQEYRDARQRMAERQVAEQQHRENHAAAAEHDRRVAAEQAQSAAATATFLQSIGNAFQRTYQPQGGNCVTTQIGASLSTRCY